MSSMRNAVQRRNHKERAQPLERQKWGLLEKHKDYSKRAKDHNRKKQAIKTLQEKASNRNEDEFYFGMVNAGSKGGVKTAKRTPGQGGGKSYTKEEIDLMKTQDVGYLRTVLQRTVKERDRLEEEAVMAEKWAGRGSAENKRVVFGEDGEVVRQAPKKPDLDIFTDEDSEGEDDDNAVRSEDEAKLRSLASKRRKVEHLKDREKQLSTALAEVEQQRARMNGTVGGINKNGVKFKVRRRR